MKKAHGITLIALIITIILLLILAGVGIGALGEGGLIQKVRTGALQGKISQLKEAGQVSIIYSATERQGRNLTEQEVLDGLIRDKVVTQGEVDSAIKDETGIITIPTKQNILLSIIPDEKMIGGYKVEGDPGDVTKIGPNRFNFAVDDVTTNSVTISGTTTGVNGGIKYRYSLDGENWGEATTETTYTFRELSQGQKVKLYMKAIDSKGNERPASNNGQEVTIGTVISAVGNIEIGVTPTILTKEDVTVKLTTSTGLEMQYQQGESVVSANWVNYTQGTTGFTTALNQTIWARLIDSTGQGGIVTSLGITNIDKVAPKEFDLTTTKTTYSITVSGETTDEGSAGTAEENIGIARYQFSINGGESFTNTSGSHTFMNLTQGTTYTVSMKAIDKAGNEKEKTTSVTTDTVTAGSGNITMTPSAAGWVNTDVKVTMSTTTGLIIQYQIGTTAGTWIDYTDKVNITANTTVYARLFETISGQGGTVATLNISNIDKEKPVITYCFVRGAWNGYMARYSWRGIWIR